MKVPDIKKKEAEVDPNLKESLAKELGTKKWFNYLLFQNKYIN